ncbi:MAG: Ada metal-binding domain-containing protein [Acidobacteriota bacterium]
METLPLESLPLAGRSMNSGAPPDGSRESMLSRMYASDPTADGLFLTGVLSTGIYCLPSCRARKPKAKNVEFFGSLTEARAAGLRPCKRCRPDGFYRGEDPDHDRLAAVLAEIRRDPTAFSTVTALAEHLGVGASKLTGLVRRHLHTTPAELLHRLRIAAAQRLLAAGEATATDVAFAVGYESVSAFYDRFKAATGLTPGAYANLGSRPYFELVLPTPFRAATPLRLLGRDPQSTLERSSEDRAVKALELPSGPALLELRFEADRVLCSLASMHRPPAAEDLRAAHAVAVRFLGLGPDPMAFEGLAAETSLAPWVARHAGLRVPLTASPWEALVWAVVGQQVNLAFAYTLRRRLAARCGRPVGDLVAHPSPQAVAELHAEDLLKLQFSRSKAAYLIDFARRITAGDLPLNGLADGTATEAERRLLELRGVGPWTAGYMLLRGFGFHNAAPIGDAGLGQAIERLAGLTGRAAAAQQAKWLAPFAPYRGLAVFHLWESLVAPA